MTTSADPFENIEQAERVKFNPTSKVMYKLGDDVIVVEVEDTAERFLFRIVVNDLPSPLTGTQTYEHVLHWQGYSMVSAYYEEIFKPWVPFKPEYAKQIASLSEFDPEPMLVIKEQTIKLEKAEEPKKVLLHTLPKNSRFRYKGFEYILQDNDEFFRAAVKISQTGSIINFNGCIEVEPISD